MISIKDRNVVLSHPNVSVLHIGIIVCAPFLSDYLRLTYVCCFIIGMMSLHYSIFTFPLLLPRQKKILRHLQIKKVRQMFVK